MEKEMKIYLRLVTTSTKTDRISKHVERVESKRKGVKRYQEIISLMPETMKKNTRYEFFEVY